MPAQKRLRIDHNPLSGLTLLRRLALPRLALLRLALSLRDPPLGIPQSRLASFRRAQLLGQLITPSLAVKLVLPTICLLRLTQDLQRDLAIRAVLIHRRVRLDLRPVDRDHPDRHQPSLPAQSPSTSSNSPAISGSCRRRNSAIVE